MRASCPAPAARGSRYSPSTVSRVERAAGAPTDRRRSTSFTAVTLCSAAMLAVTGGTVADVYSGTWVEANVEIDRGRIVYVGPRRPPRDAARISAAGKVVAPGYIEPHAHPWVLYSPTSLLEAAVPDGTTTLVYDNLFFFLAHGPDGLRTIVEAMNEAPAHVRWVARLAPQSAYDDEAERFATEVVAPLLSWPEVVASGEITGWARVARGDERLAAGIAAAKQARRRVDGHNAGASYDRLAELSAAGISADHEGISGADALNRLRLGMWTMLRQSSLRPDLEAILRDLGDVVNTSRRLMLTTDGATPSFYAERGMIGGALRIAVDCGVEPMRALQLATIDPATFLGLDEELGGLAPGRRATMVLLPRAERYTRGAGAAAGAGDAAASGDLFRPELVLVDGRVVAHDGRLTAPLPDVAWDELRGYPLAPPQTFADPAIYATSEPVPAMRYESAVINRRAEPAGPELPPGHVHAALVARDASWVTHAVIANLLDVTGFATTAT